MAGTLPHCDGTGTQQDPYIFTTEEGFKEAIAVDEGVYVEAGAENLVFDVNNGVLNNTFYFKGLSLKGKGLTIRNLNLVDTSGYIITVKRNNGTIEDVNFYNMYLTLNSDSTSGFFNFIPVGDYNAFNIKNCNFTGVCKNYYGGFKINYTSAITILFKDCTFNFNFDNKKPGSSSTNYLLEDYSGYTTYNNCTFCFSGKLISESSKTYVCIVNGYSTFTNCTFMNSQSNPLIIGYSSNSNGVNAQLIMHSSSGQNYIKMYITCGAPSTVASEDREFCITNGGSQTLINISKLTNFGSITGGINMQETNPSGDDYIYSAANLAANNFTVGTEVT